MGMNEVPFEPDVPCQSCGKMGSWDFMGDSLCVECASEGKVPPKELETRARKAFVPKPFNSKTDVKATLHISESEFQSQVIELLRLHGFKVAHFRPAMNAKGEWRTAVSADGVGFPDLVAMHQDLIAWRGEYLGIAWELKAGKNKATPEQEEWLRLFGKAGFHTGVYRPEQFEELKNLLEGM